MPQDVLIKYTLNCKFIKTINKTFGTTVKISVIIDKWCNNVKQLLKIISDRKELIFLESQSQKRMQFGNSDEEMIT